ncbi:hypothetical protein RIF29_14072 [Crotalaria pallida]|uniref:Uncharacterized protein n=1 Tax=Crotalaria pallida TaxID=3830 RepID=A0AAN9IHW9_CROPI
MAKRRGRPPKTPSSLAKKASNETDDDDGTRSKLDVALLDDEDLEEIDNLSLKKAEMLLKNLDLLREKVKEKVMIDGNTSASGKSAEKIADQINGAKNPNPATNVQNHLTQF